MKDKDFLSKCNHWNVGVSPFCLPFHGIFWYIGGIGLCFIPSTFPVWLFGRDRGEFSRKGIQQEVRWLLLENWSLHLLLKCSSSEAAPCCCRKWLESVPRLAAVSGVMGGGYGLGFSFVWLGVFFWVFWVIGFFSILASVFIFWGGYPLYISAICFCFYSALLGALCDIIFGAYFWKALNIYNVCCWYLSSSSNVGIYNSFVTA